MSRPPCPQHSTGAPRDHAIPELTNISWEGAWAGLPQRSTCAPPAPNLSHFLGLVCVFKSPFPRKMFSVLKLGVQTGDLKPFLLGIPLFFFEWLRSLHFTLLFQLKYIKL